MHLMKLKMTESKTKQEKKNQTHYETHENLWKKQTFSALGEKRICPELEEIS